MRSPSTLVCGLAAALLATTFPASAVGGHAQGLERGEVVT